MIYSVVVLVFDLIGLCLLEGYYTASKKKKHLLVVRERDRDTPLKAYTFAGHS